MEQYEPAPILKWAGGKRATAFRIAAELPGTANIYIEPFVGGCGFLLSALKTIKATRYIASDANRKLIGVYTAIQCTPETVAAEVAKIVGDGVDADSYYALREELNADTYDASTPRGAAVFIVVNRSCYGGLYRENSKGQFNVPFHSSAGDVKLPTAFPSRSEICTFSEAVKDVSFVHCDFEDSVIRAGAGDVLYADPPYVATYGGYTASGFNRHAELFTALCQAQKRGAFVAMSNSDFPLVTESFITASPPARIMRVPTRHAISVRRGDTRATEVLVILPC